MLPFHVTHISNARLIETQNQMAMEKIVDAVGNCASCGTESIPYIRDNAKTCWTGRQYGTFSPKRHILEAERPQPPRAPSLNLISHSTLSST